MKSLFEKNKILFITFLIITYYLIIYFVNVNISNIGIMSMILIMIILLISGFYVIKEYKNKKIINYKKMIIAVVAIGIIIRTAYILYTPIDIRQHDIEGDKGHLSYIATIYKTGKLPSSNNWQFYQQPLHHIIASIWLRINDFLGIDLKLAAEGIQFLTAIYSTLIMLITYSILKEMNIEDKFKVIVMTIISIHPTFIILSGSINNDILMVMFTFLSMLYLIKWYKSSNYKNTIFLALFVALGAITKISSTIIAIPILYIFIDKFFKEYFETEQRKKVIINYLLKFLIFGIIALSIGLSFSIRNMIKFKQSIFYVPEPGDSLYCGEKSLLDRFNLFSSELSKKYCDPYTDSNIIAYVIKSSLFGEYNLENSENNGSLSILLTTVNIMLILLSLISLIKILTCKEKNSIIIRMFIVYYVTQIMMYLYGNLTMPYGCTMDFRYIVPTIFLGMLFIITNLQNEKEDYYKSVVSIVALFAIFSIIFELFSMEALTI